LNGLPNYSVVDISGTTNGDATGSRRFSPIGTCIHHTSGVDSRAILTGHSQFGQELVSTDTLVAKTGKRYICCPSGRYAYGIGRVDTLIQQLSVNDNANELLLSLELEYLEHEGPTYEQYDSAAEQVTLWAIQWAWRWPFVIYGHYGIASPPGRKHDPYLFDWGAFMGRLFIWSQHANIGGLV